MVGRADEVAYKLCSTPPTQPPQTNKHTNRLSSTWAGLPPLGCPPQLTSYILSYIYQDRLLFYPSPNRSSSTWAGLRTGSPASPSTATCSRPCCGSCCWTGRTTTWRCTTARAAVGRSPGDVPYCCIHTSNKYRIFSFVHLTLQQICTRQTFLPYWKVCARGGGPQRGGVRRGGQQLEGRQVIHRIVLVQ